MSSRITQGLYDSWLVGGPVGDGAYADRFRPSELDDQTERMDPRHRHECELFGALL
jgi:hypothetical protein